MSGSNERPSHTTPQERTTAQPHWAQRAVDAEMVVDTLLRCFEQTWIAEGGSRTAFESIEEVKLARALLAGTP